MSFIFSPFLFSTSVIPSTIQPVSYESNEIRNFKIKQFFKFYFRLHLFAQKITFRLNPPPPTEEDSVCFKLSTSVESNAVGVKRTLHLSAYDFERFIFFLLFVFPAIHMVDLLNGRRHMIEIEMPKKKKEFDTSKGKKNTHTLNIIRQKAFCLLTMMGM